MSPPSPTIIGVNLDPTKIESKDDTLTFIIFSHSDNVLLFKMFMQTRSKEQVRKFCGHYERFHVREPPL